MAAEVAKRLVLTTSAASLGYERERKERVKEREKERERERERERDRERDRERESIYIHNIEK